MSYVTSPYAPVARAKAANLVLLHGYTPAQVARLTGVHRSTIARWVAKGKVRNNYKLAIDTLSSKPNHPGRHLDPAIVARICELRRTSGRYAAAIHAQLLDESILVSLSSVKRTIRRQGLARPLAKWHRAWTPPIPRPKAEQVGSLVQMDTIHIARPNGSKYYLYTIIDVYSRWAYAEYRSKLSQRDSFEVLMAAQAQAHFGFMMIQTDNGPEFSRWFHQMLLSKGTYFSKISSKQFNIVVAQINHRPRKRLGWKTPYEVFHGVTVRTLM